jgi:hypothetical protein
MNRFENTTGLLWETAMQTMKENGHQRIDIANTSEEDASLLLSMFYLGAQSLDKIMTDRRGNTEESSEALIDVRAEVYSFERKLLEIEREEQ